MKPLLRRLLIALAGLLAFPFHSHAITPSSPVITQGTVYRVIDGDTYVVNVDDAAFARFQAAAGKDQRRNRYLDPRFNSIRVRLANVDTPESVHANPKMNTQAGRDASAAVKRLIEGKQVEVRCHDWGQYGRSICNVLLGGSDVGLWLIQQGHSEYVSRWGKNPYMHREYTQAMRQRGR